VILQQINRRPIAILFQTVKTERRDGGKKKKKNPRRRVIKLENVHARRAFLSLLESVPMRLWKFCAVMRIET